MELPRLPVCVPSQRIRFELFVIFEERIILNLGFNQISDLSPLSGLTALTFLDLFANQT